MRSYLDVRLYNLADKKQQLKTYVGYTDDFFKTEVRISDNGYKFYLTKHYLFVLDAKDILTRQFNLKVSPFFSNKFELEPIRIPIERFNDFSFTILDAESGIVFLNVNHYGEDSKFGNIYASDNYGVTYSLSLPYNVRNFKGFSDFERIHSNEGTYIANVFGKNEAEKMIPYLNNPYAQHPSRDNEFHSNFIRTMITFDRGASWHKLKAPIKDMDGNPTKCKGECSLHLRGLTDEEANPVYSSPSAVGIIMGVGNVGNYLSDRPGEVSVYFSRDGGMNWTEVYDK